MFSAEGPGENVSLGLSVALDRVLRAENFKIRLVSRSF